MVDTITVQFHFDYNINQVVERKIRQNVISLEKKDYLKGKRVGGIYVGGFAPFNSIYYNARNGYVLITVSTMLLLGHEPTVSDTLAIEKEVITFFEKTFDMSMASVDSFALNRIDYKVDYVGATGLETKIFYDLRIIASNKLNNVVKSTRKTSIKYCPKNGYIELISYDKEKELRDKMKKKPLNEIFAENESIDNYLGIIRTEVKVKNRKLNYNKKSLGMAKELGNYLDINMADDYFKNYAEKVWYAEPFYRIDIAIDKIRNSKELKENMKEKLCALILKIHKNGLTQAQNFYKNKYSDSTFTSHIKKIRSLGINPLTFSKTYEIEKMENFAIRR